MLLDPMEAKMMYEERLQVAARERFAHKMRMQQPVQRDAYLPQLMTRTGESLIALGNRLKKQGDPAFGYNGR